MKRILFLGVGKRVELVQAFRSAALVLDKKIMIYGEDISDTAPALAFCDRRLTICQIKDEGYIDKLLMKARDEQIDLIIPTIDTNLLVLAENRMRFEEKGIKILISSPDMVRICRDKNATSRFFIDCGLKAPMPVNNWREYKGGYPAFIKPKDGSSSIDAYKVDNEKELEIYSKQIADYIIQPFIDGTEYTIDIFTDFEGNPVYITPRVRLAVRAGEVLKTQICLDEQIIDECKKIVKKFKPCGPITVQLIRDKNGNDYYIEINPRFGGGSPLSMKAGAKSAEVLLQLLSGDSITASPVDDGTVYSRFDQSVCIEEGKRNRPIKGVIFDLDDTLYPEKQYVRSGYKAIAYYLKCPDAEERLWRYFEKGDYAIDCYLKEIGRSDEISNCVDIYREHRPEISLYSGVVELIEELKNKEIKVGIITDGRSAGQRNKIEALGLERLISDIIITDELGGIQFRKPYDVAFRLMERRWKLPYEEIVYVGDNTAKDFQAAQQLGMKCVWLRNEDGLYQCNSQRNYITNLKEIIKLL